ncbi:MAG: hypothetical protein IAG13_28790 [Deltaproteobacteria bacterium]|nr:hypothetical protein [Nannocystaceae bacterium]
MQRLLARSQAVVVLAVLPACSDRAIATIDGTMAEGDATSISADTDASPGSATGPVTSLGGSTDAGDDDPSDPTTACPFICEPDGGSRSIECSLWDDDCPRGEKCMPWANDGGGSWNSTRCAPLDDTPAAPGEPCTVVDSGVSRIDDCERGAMCWDVDPETNVGECVAFCVGSEANPTCTDPETECTISGEGTLILCLPWCHPLMQDCNEGAGCYPGNNVFWCAPDASAAAGAFGDPCEFLNVCDPVLFCANADVVPDCAGDFGCCSEFCDLGSDEPDAMCTGARQGHVCVPWFEEAVAPPAFARVGACLLPD